MYIHTYPSFATALLLSLSLLALLLFLLLANRLARLPDSLAWTRACWLARLPGSLATSGFYNIYIYIYISLISTALVLLLLLSLLLLLLLTGWLGSLASWRLHSWVASLPTGFLLLGSGLGASSGKHRSDLWPR